METDWWHWGTVAVLMVALLFETVAAYCTQKENLISRYKAKGTQPDLWQKRWTRLFWRKGILTSEPDDPYPYEDVYYALTPEFGSFLRGVGRLMVAVLFLVRFALGMPLIWTGGV